MFLLLGKQIQVNDSKCLIILSGCPGWTQPTTIRDLQTGHPLDGVGPAVTRSEPSLFQRLRFAHARRARVDNAKPAASKLVRGTFNLHLLYDT